jgi:hypothetical protein
LLKIVQISRSNQREGCSSRKLGRFTARRGCFAWLAGRARQIFFGGPLTMKAIDPLAE